jgi:hypothetical protein
MTFYRTLSDDLSPRNISDKGFDIAFNLVDLYSNPYLKEEYFEISFY